MKDDGGPAFPLNVLDQADSGNLSSVATQYGMSLRDYFAGQALVGYLAGTLGPDIGDPMPETIARAAYRYADAMLVTRKG